LRESGSIENNADIVVFIYRDEVYHEKTKEKDTIELIFAKFRNGDSGALVKLKFFKEFQKIIEIVKGA
jgi:replicative DNA helicase